MQRNFNPHLPPGYFETHELEGLNWKSEKPVREAMNERMVAQTVKKFERDSRQEMYRQRRAKICATIRKNYRTMGIMLEIVRHPWDSIPCVLIQREDTGREDTGREDTGREENAGREAPKPG